MTADDKKNGPVVLCILDGWGYRKDSTDNAIKLAETPNYDRFWAEGSRAWLQTSGLAVGLPEGQMGNSEVGHTNIGSGRVVLQDLPRIDSAIESGQLAENAELLNYIAAMRTSGGTVHLMGLLSPGGVHSHTRHILALARILDAAGIPVRLHGFMDGRDTPPRSGLDYARELETQLEGLLDCRFATVSGRYWAMDRDKRWDRVEKAYRVITSAEGSTPAADTAEAAVQAAYARGENDEFVVPTVIGDFTGIKDGDGLLMANFRADRAREILTALLDPAFDGFDRGNHIMFAATLGMVEYSTALDAFLPALFPSEDIRDSFGEILAANGLKQLRIAETEKYAHVTFFFNGGKEAMFAGEDRILVPSPDVATYDLQPEMSAPEVTEKLVAAIESRTYAAIIVNFANPDMVGHTGILSAAIKAVQAVDTAIGKVAAAVSEVGGTLFITADHGNVELMTDQTTGVPHTAHTSFDVPVIMLGNHSPLRDGCLADVAPTMLSLMGLPVPAAMTGKNLLLDHLDQKADRLASA